MVLCGAAGQLGQTLQALWPASVLCQHFNLVALSREDLDICNKGDVRAKLSSLNCKLLINAAAYTAVDQAEEEQDNAFAINDTGVENLATWAAENHAWLIHISTDFVFDGNGSSPYLPDSETKPIGAYGRSKLAGEQQIQRLLPDSGVIIRTSWLYSEYGNNFVKTMLRLMKERPELKVVNDQIGSPSSTHSLAELIFAMICKAHDCGEQVSGIYHWSDGGNISWFDFALAIQKQALQQGLLSTQIPVQPITSNEYPTPAKRPAYSVLDRSLTLSTIDCSNLNWEQQLQIVINKIAAFDSSS
ncbi:MAG: dTDP-4-dehydrorhamnose reductase [SAR86 cluster bacterium]|uniref:dTDP-4-dehydrorhamnose reductase n=1 Tax=SAR86 cluster bacterium TaxID=2030880 RepID=A0A2A5B905_9GAMM|nr:MAG: dTDP-4-dehydrorhamnose reductase [SAR86 cluster bacterium]